MSDNNDTNDLFIQEESLLIAADDEEWKTLLNLNMQPNKKLFVNHIFAAINAGAGTPEGYFTVSVNGNKWVNNLASYNGSLIYYFWGDKKLVWTASDKFVVNVKSNGSLSECVASVAGLLFPVTKDF